MVVMKGMMKKWITLFFSVCVLILLCGGNAFAAPEKVQYYEQNGVRYMADRDKCTVISYDGSASVIVISEYIEGKTVTSIGESVFMNNTNLVSIDIPDSVSNIGKRAFSGCVNLNWIHVPASLTSIEDEAFSGCTSLPSFEMPEGLVSIGERAFYGCESLSAVNIPAGVTQIGENAFAGCDNTWFYSENGSFGEQYIKDNNFKFGKELSITNNTNMFKAISAYYEEDGNGSFLIMALSGTGYRKLFVGSYQQAVANGTDTDNWIDGYLNNDGKYEFKIPVNGRDDYIPIVAISDSYYNKYLQGQNSLERAFYPRYAKINVDAATLETGDHKFTTDLTVTNDVDDKLSLTSASLTTIGGPNSNNYKSLLELTMVDDTYDIVFVGAADEIGEDSEMIDIGEGNIFAVPVRWFESTGKPENLKNLMAAPFTVSFHSVKDSCWLIFELTVDEDGSTLNIEYKDDIFTDYEYQVEGEEENKNVVITKYKGFSKKVIIPDTIEGYPVKKISSYAFKGCNNVESIVLPNTVTRISDNAFLECSNLKSVNIPDGVTCIEAYTFFKCSSLNSIEIPNNVTTIEDHAFRGCSGLESIEIPNSVTDIGNQVFDSCSSLNSIVIPESVTSIGTSVFEQCEKIKIYVTKGSYAEEYLKNNNIAFSYTYLNEELNVSNKMGMFTVVSASIEVNKGSKCLIIALSDTGYHDLFKGTYEQAVENGDNKINWIQGNLNSDGKYEFKIPLTDGESFIPLVLISNSYYENYLNGQNSLERAFYSRYVKIDVDSATIETGDYKYTADLTVSNNDNNFNLTGAALTTISGPNSNSYKCQLELTMGDAAFDKIFIGSADEIIEDSETINIGEGNTFIIPVKWVETSGQPETLKNLLKDSFVVSFYSSDYKQCRKYEFKVDENNGTLEINLQMQEITDYDYSYFDDGVIIKKYIGSDTEVVIPTYIEGTPVTIISTAAFKDCSSIISIKIPRSVTDIEADAFRGCTSLENIEIPNSVTSIGANAFVDCTNLKSIKIPEGVKCIEDNTFLRCRSLKSIEIPDSVTRINTLAFRDCSDLESIEIPDSVTSIGIQAFDNCSKLVSVKLSNKLESIGIGVFIRCSSLKRIEIPNSLKSIEQDMFYDCSSLESIQIPNSVTSIGVSAFAGCSSLERIEIPNSVTNIGEYVFSGCEKIIFYVSKGSYAEEYLKQNNKEYKYSDGAESPSEKKTETPTEKKTDTPKVSPSKQKKIKAPAKVTIKSAKNIKGKKLKATWKKVSGAKGYEVQYSLDKKFKKAKTKTKTTKKTTITFTKLKKSKIYYVRVRAYKTNAKGKKVYGAWSKVKKVKITK